MSALLRALMGQSVTSNKPNVITVTESTREFNKPDGRQRFGSDIVGTIKKGIAYHITGDVIIDVDSTGSQAEVRLWKWDGWGVFWISGNLNVGKYAFHIDTVRTSGSNLINDHLVEFDCYNLDGTVTLKNMSATEV